MSSQRALPPGQVQWPGNPIVRPMGAPPGLDELAPPPLPAYNAREVRNHDSSPLSATVDVFTGIMDAGRLTEIRDRAIYDPDSLVWAPVADAATGILFPDAVTAKTNIESSLRMRPTAFKGPKQLDVGRENPDEHFNRMIHPLAWRKSFGMRENADGSDMAGSSSSAGSSSAGSSRGGSSRGGSSRGGSSSGSADRYPGYGAGGSGAAGGSGGVGPSDGAWYKYKGDLPFVGFPNPNYFNMYTDAIPTQNLQNITHAQMNDALRVATVGDFDHNRYLNAVGALLHSNAVPNGSVSVSNDKVIQVDGGGVNADPRILERIYDEYELEFNIAKRMRIAEQSDDPRFADVTPATPYIAEMNQFLRAQDDYFNDLQKFSGIASGFVAPAVVLT